MDLTVLLPDSATWKEGESFSPVDLAKEGLIRFAHQECLGGAVEVSDINHRKLSIRCTSCGAHEMVYNRTGFNVAMRKLMILREAQEYTEAESPHRLIPESPMTR